MAQRFDKVLLFEKEDGVGRHTSGRNSGVVHSGFNPRPGTLKAQLKWSRLKPSRRFVRMIARHLDGILAYCDKKVSLGSMESSNLKARHVIRRAYGYRDTEYMKLKIIQACTPWMAEFRPWGVPFNNPA